MNKHEHGGNVYRYQNCMDFSANCNPLGTPESVKQAVVQSLERVSDYPQPGCEKLRTALASYEQVDTQDLICGNGAAELIFSLCRALQPGQALVPAPTFAEYEQALESVGCMTRHFALEEKENFQLSQDFLGALQPDLDMVFLCNPNNPTGILTERDFLVQVLERCQEFSIFLVVDECFLDFVKEPGSYTLKEWLSDYPNLFLLKAFTKRYAMAGIRLGYGICKNRELLERMELMTQPWNVSSLAQAAGLAALEEQAYVEAGREMVFQEKEYLSSQMEALGLHVYPSQANYLFFRGPGQLFEACLEQGILIRDCSNYPGLQKGYFRIAVKTHEENQRLVVALQKILSRQTEKGI